MAMGAWKELGRAILTRRKELGLTQVEVTESGGPSRETLRLLELGERTKYRPATFMQLDTGLSWKPGTARSIVEGRADLSDPGSWSAGVHHEVTINDSVGVSDTVRAVVAGRAVSPIAQALAELRRYEDLTPTEEKATELIWEALQLVMDEWSP